MAKESRESLTSVRDVMMRGSMHERCVMMIAVIMTVMVMMIAMLR